MPTAFIQLTASTGLIYVNVQRIVMVRPSPNAAGSSLTLSHDSYGDQREVYQTPEQVLTLIAAAEAAAQAAFDHARGQLAPLRAE